MPLPTELFLSHSDRDHEFATALGRVFEHHGIPYWFSRRSMRGAQQWHDEIGAALARCDWLVLVLSPASVESTWVKRELLYALQQNRYEGRIVPVLFQDCQYERLSWTLDSIQKVDFSHGFEEGCRELLRIWSLAYAL